jgi:D-arabinose 1-dehydrogenase-like Zn-dependent alcohol dehydrogenase
MSKVLDIDLGTTTSCLAGIPMSDIPSFPYHVLWEERQVVSVANLTRQDGIGFQPLVMEFGRVMHTTRYPLRQSNQALADLRAGIRGRSRSCNMSAFKQGSVRACERRHKECL